MSFHSNWVHARNMMNGSDEDESEEVSLHRSYGKKRKVYPLWERIKLTFFQGLTLWLLIPWLIVALLLYIAFMCFFPELWFKIFVNILLWGFLLFRLTRTLRKRRKFTKKLKKLCKKKNFRIRYEQNFFQSLIWSPDKQDFVVETRDMSYYVRYLTINKYHSTLFFESENLLRLVKDSPRGFFRIFSTKSKIKKYPFDFQIPERYGRKTKKVLIANPVCAEMKTKSPNGGYETTGDGGVQFGFTVHTGSGFLEALTRDDERRKENR
ncbi:MAG: hypothetical protein IJD64_02580 [Clostridia bacterium]|nr:hypothetical protein [Clostridia bacterium]